MVCFSAPQSHLADYALPHLCNESAHMPWLVRILFSDVHILRGCSKAGGFILMHGRFLPCGGRLSVHFRSQESMGSNCEVCSSLAVLIGGLLDRNLFLHGILVYGKLRVALYTFIFSEKRCLAPEIWRRYMAQYW